MAPKLNAKAKAKAKDRICQNIQFIDTQTVILVLIQIWKVDCNIPWAAFPYVFLRIAVRLCISHYYNM
jgi:hypothetical protein